MRREKAAPALRVESLEDRSTPAVTFDFDYAYDTAGFFSDPARRAALERVGADLAGQLASTPAAITPGGGNSWTASFFHPATGAQTRVTDLTIPDGVVKVFAGARSLDGAAAAQGGYGGYGASGTADWFNQVAGRGQAFSVWGGSLTFDPDQDWYFGADPAGVRADTVDFYTVSTHELGHLLGLGTAPTFRQLVAGGRFTGEHATEVFGSAPPVTGDGHHWRIGVSSGGQPASLQATLTNGQRYGLSPLDVAALADIGWQVTSSTPTSPPPVTSPPPATSPPPVISPPPVTSPPPAPAVPPTPPAEPGTGTNDELTVEPVPPCRCGACAGCVAVTGITGGTVQLFDASVPGQATPTGDAVQPFPDFAGVVRATTADVNADGTPDLVAVTGPGGGSRVRVIDGRAGTDLLPAYWVFEPGYTGGLYVAAADLDRDGRAEVVVSPDRGGGGRVVVLAVAGGSARVAANFFGIEDAAFRGGARVAAADVSGDGVPEIVVGAGFGGGPRVAVFDGASVTTRPRKLMNDFFAFDGPDAVSLRNGVFPAAGDLDADGRADLVFGGGPGGGPRVFALSGSLLTTNPDLAKAAPLANFFAFGSGERGGARPVVRDVTKDGVADLVVGSGEGVAARVMVCPGGAYSFAGGGAAEATTAEPFGLAIPMDGVYVG